MSDEADLIEREIFIEASPETVFEFLVEPDLMAQWIGLAHTLEPRPGGTFRVEVSQGYVARGVYQEVVRPRRVVFTWGWEEADDATMRTLRPGASVVEIDLEPRDGGTRLRFRHSGLTKATSSRHGERWSHYLSRLAASACSQEADDRKRRTR
jgi:uncharacterized protein YndB with AHSA1/START domain